MEQSKWLTIWHQWIATVSIGIIKLILLCSLDYSPKHLCHSLLHQLPDPARGEKKNHQPSKQHFMLRRKSISKPNSPIPEEALRLLKMLGNRSLKYENIYWQVDRKAQRSWPKGLVDSPTLRFTQRQSRPAAVCPAAGLPFTNTFFPFC